MPRVESEEPPRLPSASQADLAAYIRKNLIRTVVSLAVLFLVLFVVGKTYEQELLALTGGIYHRIGIAGLLGVVFVSDAIFSPVPPDVVLVVIANSTLRTSWYWLLPAIGAVSALAGHAGWFIGRRFAGFRWANGFIGRVRNQHQDVIYRYDRWAVALGALTPLPFSLICITAGALGMPLKRLSPITLLRLPKFLLVYAVIASSINL